MAEPNIDTTDKEKIPTTEPTKTPEVPSLDTIKTQAAEAAKAAVLEVLASQKKEVESVTKDDIKKILSDQRKEIANSIAGVTEDEADPVLTAFIKNPKDVLALLKEMTLDEAKSYVNGVFGQHLENRAAGQEVLAKRPDIYGTEENKELFELFFKTTDDKKSTKERLTDAVTQYDLHMEKRGAGDSKTRIAQAGSISSASASSSKDAPAGKKSGKTEAELLNEELAGRRTRAKAQRNMFR